MFNIISGITGANLNYKYIFIIGFAVLISDGLSMGISDYLSLHADMKLKQNYKKNNLIDEGIAFDLRILSICKKVKIKCISKSSQLAKKLKYETHFVLDGHLYPKASAEYGKMLGDELTKIIKNDK